MHKTSNYIFPETSITPDNTQITALVTQAQLGDQNAKTEIIAHASNLLRKQARERLFGRADREDLYQAGTIGILKAIEHFDCSLGTSFFAFAAWYSADEMNHYLSEMASSISLPHDIGKRLSAVAKYEQEYFRLNGCKPTDNVIAAETNLSVRQIRNIHSDVLSCHYLQDEVGEGKTLQDFVADYGCEPETEELPISEINLIDFLLESGLYDEVLTSQEKLVIDYSFGLRNHPRIKFKDIASMIGKSRESVRLYYKSALAKLHDIIATESFFEHYTNYINKYLY